jgi:arylsulfatase A-like enzyme
MFRVLLAFAAAMCAAASPGLAAEPATKPARTPNVVVFLADDLGVRDLGYCGSTFYESPNIDALAKRGCVFTHAYSAGPVCSPTRAALMTGRYPARVGVTDWIGGPQPDEAKTLPRWKGKPVVPAAYNEHLALEETTLGEAMHDAGYATCFLGKWHLGGPKFYPDKQGFDTVIGTTPYGSPGKGGYFSPYRVELPAGPAGEHLDLRLANEAASWIGQREKARPFFLYFALYDVHTPLMAPPKTIEYFEAKRKQANLADEFGREGESKLRLNQAHATYAAMVKTMDDAVGVVMKELESQKLLDDTIIIFTSDNGGVATAEGWPTSNAPNRAGKGWAYEGGVRVPMLVIAPGITKAESSSDAPAISTDLFPTVLALCGHPARPKDHVDGVSLLPALRNESLLERPLFWHYPHYGNQGGSPYSAIRSGGWKLIAFHNVAQEMELYDLKSDPGETKNLAAAEPERVAALRKTLDDWKRDVRAVDATPAATVSAN